MRREDGVSEIIRGSRDLRRAAELVENSVTSSRKPGFLSDFISTDDSTSGISEMVIGSESREITDLRRENALFRQFTSSQRNFLRSSATNRIFLQYYIEYSTINYEASTKKLLSSLYDEFF